MLKTASSHKVWIIQRMGHEQQERIVHPSSLPTTNNKSNDYNYNPVVQYLCNNWHSAQQVFISIRTHPLSNVVDHTGSPWLIRSVVNTQWWWKYMKLRCQLMFVDANYIRIMDKTRQQNLRITIRMLWNYCMLLYFSLHNFRWLLLQ